MGPHTSTTDYLPPSTINASAPLPHKKKMMKTKIAAVLFAFCLCFVAVTLATDNLKERTGATVVPATAVVGSTANVATVPTTQKVVTVSTSSASSLSPFCFTTFW